MLRGTWGLNPAAADFFGFSTTMACVDNTMPATEEAF